MEQLCDFGCEQKAVHRFRYKVTRKNAQEPKWCCSKSSNSCPAVKAKKRERVVERYGVESVFNILEIRNKTIAAIQTSERVEKIRQTNIVKYGVANSFQRSDIKALIRETLPSQSIEAMEKKKQTRVANGYQIPDEQLSEWQTYQKDVQKFTRKAWRLERDKIKDSHLKRGRTTHHLDHIVSVYDGFVNNVPPEIIGSHFNLRLYAASKNCSKRSKSDMTLQELYSYYG